MTTKKITNTKGGERVTSSKGDPILSKKATDYEGGNKTSEPKSLVRKTELDKQKILDAEGQPEYKGLDRTHPIWPGRVNSPGDLAKYQGTLGPHSPEPHSYR